jgi:hypothetical protein
MASRFETEKKPEILQCRLAHDNNNQKDLINYLHSACFSPVKSTWIKAIKMAVFHIGQDRMNTLLTSICPNLPPPQNAI